MLPLTVRCGWLHCSPCGNAINCVTLGESGYWLVFPKYLVWFSPLHISYANSVSAYLLSSCAAAAPWFVVTKLMWQLAGHKLAVVDSHLAKFVGRWESALTEQEFPLSGAFISKLTCTSVIMRTAVFLICYSQCEIPIPAQECATARFTNFSRLLDCSVFTTDHH